MSRASWPEYFMKIARQVASRSTCDRLHVGCVLVKDKIILSTGYNGSVRGLPHCDDEGHDIVDGHCVRTLHAEVNAVLQAAKRGVAIDGASCYVSYFPCWPCFKMLANAGIRVIYYGDIYSKAATSIDRTREAAKELGIELVHMKGLGESVSDGLRRMGFKEPSKEEGDANLEDNLIMME